LRVLNVGCSRKGWAKFDQQRARTENRGNAWKASPKKPMALDGGRDEKRALQTPLRGGGGNRLRKKHTGRTPVQEEARFFHRG